MKKVFFLFLLLFSLPLMVPAQADDSEAKELEDAIVKSLNEGNQKDFFELTQKLKKLYSKQNQYDKYYEVCGKEMTFMINNHNGILAYRNAKEMKQEAISEHNDYGQYVAEYILACYYSSIGNGFNAEKHYINAINIASTKLKDFDTCRLYFSLAISNINKNPREALKWIEKGLEANNASTEMKSVAAALKCLAAFQLNDSALFRNVYSEFAFYKEHHPDERNALYDGYVETYKLLMDGKYAKANELARKINNGQNLYLRMVTCQHTGDFEGALNFYKKNIHYLDSLKNVEQRGRIDEYSKGLDYDSLRRNMDRLEIQNKIIKVAIAAGILIVISIFLFYYLRTKESSKRSLEEKNHALGEERNKVIKSRNQMLAAMKRNAEFVEGMGLQLQAPLNAIAKDAKTLADPDRELSTEECLRLGKQVDDNTKKLMALVKDIQALAGMHDTSIIGKKEALPCNELTDIIMDNALARKPENVTITLENTVNDFEEIVTDVKMVSNLMSKIFEVAGQILQDVGEDAEKEVVLHVSSDSERQALVYLFTIPCKQLRDNILPAVKEAVNSSDDALDSTEYLGLNIARTISSLLDSQLTVDESYSEGIRFSFVLKK